ncbi:AAA family ATPase [Alsobacter sp. R-9]
MSTGADLDATLEQAGLLERWEPVPPFGAEAPAATPRPPFRTVSAFPFDPAEIPVRPWIVPGLVLHGLVTFFAAPPGAGKSLLTLQWSIAMALGIPWGGWTPRRRYRVLVINTEDDLDEQRRRLAAACEVMGVDQADLVGWLLLPDQAELTEGGIVIAKADPKSKTITRTPLVESLVQTIEANRIDALVVDPFAETFEGDENSNSEVKWVGTTWRDQVAKRTNAGIILVHHTRKYAGDMAGDPDAMRGGGSLIGVGRVVCTLFPMTREEAGKLGVDEDDRSRLVRFDDAKANLFLTTGKARWLRRVSISLPNGRDGIPGDEVGALVPWTPPTVFAAHSYGDLNRALDAIERGEIDDDGNPTGWRFAMEARTLPNRRASTIVAEVLGIEEPQAKRIVDEWIKNEVLVSRPYKDGGRKERKGLFVNNDRRPGTSS